MPFACPPTAPKPMSQAPFIISRSYTPAHCPPALLTPSLDTRLGPFMATPVFLLLPPLLLSAASNCYSGSASLLNAHSAHLGLPFVASIAFWKCPPALVHIARSHLFFIPHSPRNGTGTHCSFHLALNICSPVSDIYVSDIMDFS